MLCMLIRCIVPIVKLRLNLRENLLDQTTLILYSLFKITQYLNIRKYSKSGDFLLMTKQHEFQICCLKLHSHSENTLTVVIFLIRSYKTSPAVNFSLLTPLYRHQRNTLQISLRRFLSPQIKRQQQRFNTLVI